VGVAGERPNPEFTYTAARDTPHQIFSFSVPFETASKRGRRIAVSQASVAVAEADVARDAADLRAEVRRVFFELMAADRRVAVAGELAALARRAREAANTRFQSGAAPQLDVVQADLALARTDILDARTRGERRATEAELDGLLGLSPDTPLVPVGDLFVDDTSAPTTGSSVDLTAARRRVSAAQAAVDVARSLQYPDPTISAGLSYDAPPDFTYGWEAGLTLTVPLFTHHRAGVLRAEQMAAQTVATQSAAEADVSVRTKAAQLRVAALRDARLRTTRDILPSAETVARMAQESYEAGQTGMVGLLQSLQTVGETRLEAVEVALAFQLALADLERATGAPVK
jgi:cobalt-zinc-cadmium efflux system outer membrane protein